MVQMRAVRLEEAGCAEQLRQLQHTAAGTGMAATVLEQQRDALRAQADALKGNNAALGMTHSEKISGFSHDCAEATSTRFWLIFCRFAITPMVF